MSTCDSTGTSRSPAEFNLRNGATQRTGQQHLHNHTSLITSPRISYSPIECLRLALPRIDAVALKWSLWMHQEVPGFTVHSSRMCH